MRTELLASGIKYSVVPCYSPLLSESNSALRVVFNFLQERVPHSLPSLETNDRVLKNK